MSLCVCLFFPRLVEHLAECDNFFVFCHASPIHPSVVVSVSVEKATLSVADLAHIIKGSEFGFRCTEREQKNRLILLSRTQAGPGRAVKQEQAQNSRNHLQAFWLDSVEP